MRRAQLVFGFIAVWQLLVADPLFGQVTGTVRYTGQIPPNASRPVDVTGVWKVGPHSELGDVVVYVNFKEREGRTADTPKAPASVTVTDGQFVPHIVTAQVGQDLQLGNADRVRHVVEGWSRFNKAFASGFGPGVTQVKQTIHTPEMFRLWCDKKDTAWVCAFDHPYFAATGAAGTFEIPHRLPDGEYTIVAWHESGHTCVKRANVKDGKASVDFKISPDGVLDEPLSTLPDSLIPISNEVFLADLGVEYVLVEDGGIAPGYFDRNNAVFCRWRGVRLGVDEFQKLGLAKFGTLNVALIQSVRLDEKPLICMREVGAKWALGYFDQKSRLFFRWRIGAWLSNALVLQLLGRKVVHEQRARDEELRTIDIDVPPYMLPRLRTWQAEAELIEQSK